MREKLRQIVEVNDRGPGKKFALMIQVLIGISIISFTLETVPGLSEKTVKTLDVLEFILIMIFSAEYLVRLYAAEKRLKFAFSFFGLVDLLSILPFYLALGFDLRSLRILRVTRVFRILKLARYNKALDHFKSAFLSIREELTIFTLFAFITLYLSAVGIYYFEDAAQPQHFKSVVHSLWWAICTLTTVGYGDVFPITSGGKIFTFFMLIIGIGIIAIPTGLFASSLSSSVKDKKDSEKQ